MIFVPVLDLQFERCYIQSNLFGFPEARVSNGSQLPILAGVVLAATFLLLSCGSRLGPAQLTVRIPERYNGPLHISTCMPQAPDKEITVDAQGVAATSVCPDSSTRVELRIIQNDRQYLIPEKDVHILRTGDGIATSMEALVRQ